MRPHCNRRNVELSCGNSQESSVLLAPINILEKSRFREREAQAVANDEMIEHPHVHEAEGFLEAPGDELVRLARLEHTGGVLGCISACNRHLFPLGSRFTVPHT